MNYVVGYGHGFQDAVLALDTRIYDAIPEDYGMVYSPDPGLGSIDWSQVSAQTVDPTAQPVYATEPEIRSGIVEGLLQGVEPMREGYLPHLVRKDGELYVMDGHHRMAVLMMIGQPFEALVKDM